MPIRPRDVLVGFKHKNTTTTSISGLLNCLEWRSMPEIGQHQFHRNMNSLGFCVSISFPRKYAFVYRIDRQTNTREKCFRQLIFLWRAIFSLNETCVHKKTRNSWKGNMPDSYYPPTGYVQIYKPENSSNHVSFQHKTRRSTGFEAL